MPSSSFVLDKCARKHLLAHRRAAPQVGRRSSRAQVAVVLHDEPRILVAAGAAIPRDRSPCRSRGCRPTEEWRHRRDTLMRATSAFPSACPSAIAVGRYVRPKCPVRHDRLPGNQGEESGVGGAIAYATCDNVVRSLRTPSASQSVCEMSPIRHDRSVPGIPSAHSDKECSPALKQCWQLVRESAHKLG